MASTICLLPFAFFLFPFAQAMAETITIDGVVDETPGRSFRAAGGELTITLDQSPSEFVQNSIVIGDPNNPHKDRYLKADFGNSTIITYTTDSKERTKLGGFINEAATQLIFNVFTTNVKIATSNDITEIITRDPKHPIDHDYRIEVTEWTPGKNGHPGTAKIVLKKM